MKRAAILLCAAAAAILAGCSFLPVVRGSGYTVTTSFAVGSFSHVMAMQNCKVSIVPDAVTSLTITSDDNLVSYLTVTRNGPDSILIGLKQGYIYVGTTFSAEVHVPTLSAVDMSGASQAVVEPGFPAADTLAVTLSGASTADLQQVTIGTLAIDLSGSSTLSGTGRVGQVTAVLSGASTAHLLDLPALSARADLSGASECWLNVGAGTMDLSASGASTLYYRGSPQVRQVNLSGASKLVQVP